MSEACRRRVVITGTGMVTPLGDTVRSTWSSLLEGHSGVARIRRFDPTGFPVTFAGEAALPGEPSTLKARMTRQAVAEATAACGLPTGPDVGVCVGSEAARPLLSVLAHRYRTGELPTPEEMTSSAPWAPSEEVARLTGASGPRSTISTACTSSGQAIGEAYLRIRRGHLRAVLAGGVDELVDPLMIAGFSLLGALSQRNHDPEGASRPFDIDRDGFVLGEGAAFLVLEELESARARGAPILGEILGYGCSLNAWRITDSPPDGRGAGDAMEMALRDAGRSIDDVGYINAHGTSTQQNDASESAAIHRVFGERARHVPVSSTKSMTGHLVAACGAVEALFCMLAIRDGVLPHTRNLDHPDPACDLDHVRGGPREAKVRLALSNSFGFGGSNAVLALGPVP